MDLLRTLSLVALVAVTARAQDDKTLPPMSLQTFWLPDSEPASLEAAILSTELVPSPTVDPIRTETVVHYRFSCPTARSPENDACRAASIYPADVYHSAGPVWGGTTTYGVDDTTTTWVCTLGRSGNDPGTWGHFGECTKTIVSDGSSRTESTRFDTCYVAAHHVPVVVTEGADLLPSAHYLEYYQEITAASELNAAHASDMEEYGGCPASETTMFAGAVETAAGGGGPSGGVTSEAPETGSGANGSGAAPTSSGDPAAETSEASDSGAVAIQQGLGMSGLVAALVALGCLAL